MLTSEGRQVYASRLKEKITNKTEGELRERSKVEEERTWDAAERAKKKEEPYKN